MPLSAKPSTRPRSDCLVMFGITGDLAKKKLFPAVYRLHERGLLDIPVIGVALDDWTTTTCRTHVARVDRGVTARSSTRPSSTGLAASSLRVGRLRRPRHLREGQDGGGRRPAPRSSTWPSRRRCSPRWPTGLAGVGLHEGSRLIVEKPFGRDLDSARRAQRHLHAHFPESAIFRIDHFLGKEAMRSLLITRFANAILEPLWHRTYVSRVKITMAEAFGVEDRGAFYDSVGALRDVMQNHLLQMVALFAMEQPVNEHSKALRDEKAKVLQAARPSTPSTTCGASTRATSTSRAWQPDSDTETYGAFRLDYRLAPLGRRALLPAGRQGAGRDRHRDDHRVRAAARPLWIADDCHLPPNRIRIEAKPDSFAALTWLHKAPGDRDDGRADHARPRPPDGAATSGPSPTSC